jgi:CheY-like chemotaxis protein
VSGRLQPVLLASTETAEASVLLPFPHQSPVPPRVLVAESNSINRKVIVQLLENLGCDVSSVRSGSEALAAAGRSVYDLVLLDCEGLEPSGYEVARILRAAQGTGKHIPILALTGAGSENDRHQREAAGIDDYIAKPVDPTTAQNVLGRWAPGLETAASGNPTSLEKGVLAGLQRLGGEESGTLVEELIEIFLGSTPQQIGRMRQAIRDHDSSGLASLAFAVRSGSGQMGAIRMREIATALEALASTGSVKEALPLVEELARAFERASQDLQALGKLPSAPEPEIRKAEEHGPRLDAAAIRPAFEGRRLVVLHEDEAVLKALSGALENTGCELIAIADPAAFDVEWARRSDLLFLGAANGQSKALGLWRRLRQEGVRVPVIVTVRAPNPVLLQYIEELGGDCILEPLRAEDVLFQAYRRLISQAGAHVAAARSLDVLVVEEDPLTARFLVSTLEASGYRVTHLPDGQQALQVLRQKLFGLVLLDAEVPTIDGYDLLEKLRLEPKHRHTPVLMLSGKTQENDVVRAFELGADDVVTKPFNPLELMTRARRLTKA